jgi:hypothetical protein
MSVSPRSAFFASTLNMPPLQTLPSFLFRQMPPDCRAIVSAFAFQAFAAFDFSPVFIFAFFAAFRISVTDTTPPFR